MVYVVLGSSASGTTVVSQMLHASGIKMVADEENLDYFTGNLAERFATKGINKRLIAASRDKYQLSGLNDKKSAQIRAQMQEVIKEQETAQNTWGFKDPRTCTTYPLWAEELPPHRIVFVYRRYAQVLRHFEKVIALRRYNKIMLWNKLIRWVKNNVNCLTYIEQTDCPYTIINYGKFMSDDEEVLRLESFIERPLVDVRRPGYFRSRSTDTYQLPFEKGLGPFLLPQSAADTLFQLDKLHSKTHA